MINNLALVTVLFDYPPNSQPIYIENAKKYFKHDDIYIGQFSGLPSNTSYYEKLCAYKVDFLLPFIKENIQNKYEYLLFMDATDTNFYRNPDFIIETFLSFNKSIVFCGEKELWPTNSYSHLYNQKEELGVFKYLNSGCYIGYTDKIIYHLEQMLERNSLERISDQSIWSIEYLLSEDIGIDYNNQIFYSTHISKEYVDSLTPEVKLKTINPYIVHDNGPFGDDTIKLANLL